MAEAPRDIKLKSSDGFVFSVSRDVIAKSSTLTTLIQDLGLDDKDAPESREPEPLQLYNVNGRTLKKVLEWCEHYAGKPNPTPWTPSSEWVFEYVKMSNQQVIDVFLASQNLHIQQLMWLCCWVFIDGQNIKRDERARGESMGQRQEASESS